MIACSSSSAAACWPTRISAPAMFRRIAVASRPVRLGQPRPQIEQADVREAAVGRERQQARLARHRHRPHRASRPCATASVSFAVVAGPSPSSRRRTSCSVATASPFTCVSASPGMTPLAPVDPVAPVDPADPAVPTAPGAAALPPRAALPAPAGAFAFAVFAALAVPLPATSTTTGPRRCKHVDEREAERAPQQRRRHTRRVELAHGRGGAVQPTARSCRARSRPPIAARARRCPRRRSVVSPSAATPWTFNAFASRADRSRRASAFA